MPVICSRRIRFTPSMRVCISRKPGTIREMMKPTARNSTGTQTTSSQDSPRSSRIAISTPPTIMIGAATIIVQVISTSICTCWTSLVLRVISDGAPIWATSRLQNVPTRWNRPRAQVAAERHRGPRPDVHRGAAAEDLHERDHQHHGAGAHDVAGVAAGHAAVDDVGVQAGQVQRGHGADELQQHDERERPAVGREVLLQDPDQHVSLQAGGSGADATEQDVGDLGGGEHLLRLGAGVPHAEHQRAQQQRRLAGLDGELVAVRLEDLGEPVEQRTVRVEDELRRPGRVLVRPGRLGHPHLAQRHHHRDDLLRARVHALGGDQHPLAQVGDPRERRGQLGLPGGGVHGLGGRHQQRGLVGEDPEDRALGDAGGLGDLLGGHAAAVLEQQRHDDVDDRAAAVVGGHRRGAPVAGGVVTRTC